MRYTPWSDDWRDGFCSAQIEQDTNSSIYLKTRVPNTVSGAAALAYFGSPTNQTYGPGNERIDMSLFKAFPVFREQFLQFRADAFNILNTPGYGDPSNTSISSGGGLITGARTFQRNTPNSRFFQFALKYVF